MSRDSVAVEHNLYAASPLRRRLPWLPTITDQSVMDYRLRTVRIGVHTTFIALAALALWLILPHSEISSRGLYVMLLLTALSGVLVVRMLPWERLFISGYGHYVLYAWSVFNIVLITVFVGLLGVDNAVPVLLYALTTVFFAASYPPSGQVILLLFTFTCYLTVVWLSSQDVKAGDLALSIGSLCAMAFMASFLSRELMSKMREASRERAESERRAGLLANVAGAARKMTALGTDRVMEVVVKSATKLGFEASEICAVVEEARAYTVIHHSGLPSAYVTVPHPSDEGIIALALERGKAIAVEDYAQVPGANPALVDEGFKSVLAVPIKVDNRIVAVLVAGTKESRPLGDEDVEAFELLAAHAGRAWEVANKYHELQAAEKALRASVEERETAQEQQRALEAQLHHSQKMEAIGQLAGGIAHDFNNLIGVILGYAQFVADDLGEDDPRRADTDEIVNAARRAAELTQHLLTFSRRERVAPETIDVNRAIGDLEGLMRRTIRESITFSIELGDEVGSTQLGTGQLDQILMNMAVNARDAMEAGGALTIRTSSVQTSGPRRPELPAGDYIRIEVSDTGIGMTQEIASRIFEPFFTTKEKGGTGLGLATAYGIVTQAGGHIFVDTEAGRGTTFDIYLPAHDGQAEAEPTGASDDLRAAAGETILVVEDEDGARRFAQRVLKQHGYNVLSAASGAGALRLYERCGGNVDLLVTDVMMPGMSGKELYDRLQSRGATITTLFMSGYPDEIVRNEGLTLDPTTYLQKPFESRDLLARVGALLQARPVG